MTDVRHEVEWQLSFGKSEVWKSPSGFVWLYGSHNKELLLHHLANIYLAPESKAQLARATHWAPGPNPHEDEIYLPYPPKEE